MSEIINDSTSVSQVDLDLDEIFGTPGAENIMLPAQEETIDEKKSVFTRETVDTTFLDKPVETSVEVKATPEEVEEAIAELDNRIAQEEESGSKGRLRERFGRMSVIMLAVSLI